VAKQEKVAGKQTMLLIRFVLHAIASMVKSKPNVSAALAVIDPSSNPASNMCVPVEQKLSQMIRLEQIY
jgi:hypothetical protein